MTPRFQDYIKAAFSYKPLGMFISPNWVGLAMFTLLGVAENFGFLLLGAGLELGYLYALAMNSRFQRLVGLEFKQKARAEWEKKLEGMVSQLASAEQARYRALADRCDSVLHVQRRGAESFPGLEEQRDGLQRLLWIYLRLLTARHTISAMLKESERMDAGGPPLDARLESLRQQLGNGTLRDELRKSLQGQLEILERRLKQRDDAREKLAFLNAELTRIQEQVELIREQATLPDPAAVSERIDAVASTLDGAQEWVRQQQQFIGQVEDLEEPPAEIESQPEVRAVPPKERA